MSNTVDDLMNRDPLDMTPADIDELILHFRARRVNVVAGKPKKEEGPKLKLDLAEIGLTAPPSEKPLPRLRRF